MTNEYIRYRIDEARRDAFIEAYREAGRGQAIPSGLRARTMRFALRIHWTSTDGHMTSFRGSESLRRFFPPIRPYVHGIEEIQLHS